MDDIEAVIEIAKHFKFHEKNGVSILNRISSLPESKKHLKLAIKERIEILVGSYISLATFIDDDLLDSLENNEKEIYQKVLLDIETSTGEMREFLVSILPTSPA